MKVTLLCFSLLAVLTVCLSIPSTNFPNVWFPVFNPPVRNFVANFAAGAQQGMGSWSGAIMSVMGKRRLCRAFVFWGFGAPFLMKNGGADRHGRSQCFN